MKNIISMIVFVTIIQAKPCMTDIYFGNGIWSQNRLEQISSLVALKNISNFDKNTKKNINFRLAYNPGNSTLNDLIETYWQLKESGQITEGYFISVYIALAGKYTVDAWVTQLLDIINNYNIEVNAMYTALNNVSFKKNSNVLFLGHSQGNLFGNKMYELLNDSQKEKFRMVSVGTIASTVAGGGKYINIEEDYVVNFIPDSLKGEFDGSGHDFKGVYLNIDSDRHSYDTGSNDAGNQIHLDIINAYNNLLSNTECTEYDTIYLYIDGRLDMVQIKGKIAGTNGTELISEQKVETKVIDNECNNYPKIGYRHPNLYFFKDNLYAWTIPPFTTQEQVLLHQFDKIQYRTLNYECADISFEDTLFDIVYKSLEK